MAEKSHLKVQATDEAVGFIPTNSSEPITVIGTDAIRNSFDATCLQQALNSAEAPGVSNLILNPDAHAGYGAPVGSVLVSPTHIYPGPVGVDIKCSMSLLQLNIPEDAIVEKSLRREVIDAILARTPTGPGKGQRSVKKSRRVSLELGRNIVCGGATAQNCIALGIPMHWADRCEDAVHVGAEGSAGGLQTRLDALLAAGIIRNFEEKIQQLGSYGGGNHFGEANIVKLASSARAEEAAAVFGLQDGNVAFLSHCGSRGFGNILAQNQFRTMQSQFQSAKLAYPGGDRELVYAPLGTPQADAYLDDMALGANFATLNHLLINALVLEAFQEVLPGTKGELVYFISHNIARQEEVDGKNTWVHRKGATRAFPAGHPALKDTAYFGVGHPILLPGNPLAGSVIMTADPGATKSCFSVNHGAGRAMGRRQAMRLLDQKSVDIELSKADILSNCRSYPLDEAPAAYKDFNEVVRSVELAGLASTIARLKASFVIKDGETELKGMA